MQKYKDFGEVIKEKRLKQGMSQLEASQVLNCDQAIVSKTERGIIDPSFNTVRQWSHDFTVQEGAVLALVGTSPEAITILQNAIEALSGVTAFVSMLGGIL